MRISMVCPYALDVPGGVQDQATGLAARLTERGHDVDVVGPSQEPGPWIRVGRPTRLAANGSVAPVALDPGTVGRVRRAVASSDLVHVHEPLMPVVSLATLGGGPPVVGTFHADPSPRIRAAYRHARRLLRVMVGRMAAITAVSPVAAAAIAPFAPEPEVIPNAIDVAGMAAREARVAGRVVFLGRDEPRKGLDVLLAAWPAIRGRHPQATLEVVGAHRTDPIAGVRFLGRVDEATKRRSLGSASVFVAPHLGGESFGIVVAEAMAAGAAVVASDLPAFRYVLGDTGITTPAGDRAALAAAVGRLLDDPSLLARTADACERRAARYDWSAVVDRYVDIYETALR